MHRFKSLKYNEAFMAILRVYSPDTTNSPFKSVTVQLLLVVITTCFSLTALGIYENWPDLELVLNAIVMVVTPAQVGGMLISLCLNTDKIQILYGKLQEIVDQGESIFKHHIRLVSIHQEISY